MIVSCQKDQDISGAAVNQTVNADSLAALNSLNAPGNYLAVKGSLKITLQDSTYIFDAAHDSIAFVSVHAGSNQYYGITAINKAHNMSFGISSPGAALSNSSSVIAGSQLLLRNNNKPDVEYALTKYAVLKDFGKISLTSYKQDSTLARGTFYTFLAKDEKANSPVYKVKGVFSLQLR